MKIKELLIQIVKNLNYVHLLVISIWLTVKSLKIKNGFATTCIKLSIVMKKVNMLTNVLQV